MPLLNVPYIITLTLKSCAFMQDAFNLSANNVYPSIKIIIHL